jgi:phenylacetate-CoA ligase
MFNEFKLSLFYRIRGLSISPLKLFWQMKDAESWSKEQFQSHRIERLKKLFSIANMEVKYYRNDLPDDIDHVNLVEKMENLPIVSREKMDENREDFLNQKLQKFYINTTSGSTGYPFKVLVSLKAKCLRIASLHYFLSWWGVNLGDKHVYVWGNTERNKFSKSIASYFKNWLQSRMYINVFEINENNINSILKSISGFKPKYMRGYVSAFVEIANIIKKKKIIFKNDFCVVIVVTAEVLFDEQKELIETVFGCKVANEYGSSEVGIIGFECPKGSVHLNEYCNYVRTNKNNNVLITDLFNYKMPIINYFNKDRLEISEKKCSCGRSTKIISSIQGRITDYIVREDGIKVSSFVLNFIIMEINNSEQYENSIKQFKFVQKNSELIAEIVANDNYTSDVDAIIIQLVKLNICPDVKVKIIQKEFIPREKSGKLLFFKRVEEESVI